MSSNRLALFDYLEGQGTFGRNYIKNPSGLKNATRGITASGMTVTRNTTAPLTAISDIQIVSSANNQYAIFDTNTLDNSLSGQACELTFTYKLTLGSSTRVITAGIEINGVVTNSLTLINSSTPQNVSLIAPCGDLTNATTIAFRRVSGSLGTSTLNVANLYYGAAKNIGTVAQAQQVVSALRITSTQSVAVATPVQVVFNSAPLDRYSEFNTTTGLFTAKRSAELLVSASLEVINYTTSQAVFLFVYKNGAAVCRAYADVVTSTSPYVIISPCHVSVNVGDTVAIYVDSNGDSAYDVQASESSKVSISAFPTSSETVARLDAPGVGWTAFTPTGSWTTNTTYTGFYQCDAGNLTVDATASLSGAPTSTRLTFNLPSGFTIDSSKMSTTTRSYVGHGTILDNGVRYIIGDAWIESSATGVISVSHRPTISGTNPVITEATDVTQANPITFGASDKVSIFATVPVTASSPCPKSPQVLIPGSVYSNTASTIRHEYASMTAQCTINGTCATADKSDGITITRTSTGVYSVTFSPAFAAVPACSVTTNRSWDIGTTPTTSSYSVQGFTSATTTPADISFQINCFGKK